MESNLDKKYNIHALSEKRYNILVWKQEHENLQYKERAEQVALANILIENLGDLIYAYEKENIDEIKVLWKENELLLSIAVEMLA